MTTNHPLIDAFSHCAGGYRPDVLEKFDPAQHRIAVLIDNSVVGEIVPGGEGYREMAYAYEYRGATRGRDGVTPIGPAFDPEGMKRRIISVMFNGDADAFARSRLERRRR